MYALAVWQVVCNSAGILICVCSVLWMLDALFLSGKVWGFDADITLISVDDFEMNTAGTQGLRWSSRDDTRRGDQKESKAGAKAKKHSCQHIKGTTGTPGATCYRPSGASLCCSKLWAPVQLNTGITVQRFFLLILKCIMIRNISWMLMEKNNHDCNSKSNITLWNPCECSMCAECGFGQDEGAVRNLSALFASTPLFPKKRKHPDARDVVRPCLRWIHLYAGVQVSALAPFPWFLHRRILYNVWTVWYLGYAQLIQRV